MDILLMVALIIVTGIALSVAAGAVIQLHWKLRELDQIINQLIAQRHKQDLAQMRKLKKIFNQKIILGNK
jgi:hypothetical protein